MIMNFRMLTAVVPATLVAIAAGMATAGESINVAGTMACVNDKWDEKEPAKGHKLADYAGRCVVIPDDAGAQKYVENCVGNYEYKPDGSWKGSGSCNIDFKGPDKLTLTWQEGSDLKEYPYEFTGGTGKYEGAKGGGTYKTEELTTTLYGGRKAGKLELR
jgi:hypothetical protein